MLLHELVKTIEQAVPPEYALPGDPIGLQIGNPEQQISRVLVGLEASTQFLRKAQEVQAQLLLVHHPLIYRPLKNILLHHPVQRMVYEIIRQDLALYAAHTNADLHPEGLAKVWATKLGLEKVHPFAPKPMADALKLVTFVPEEHTDQVRDALCAAGAGRIGEYEKCSFYAPGTGTFQGSERTDPYIGKAEEMERVQENKLELLVPLRRKFAVLQALYDSHPYEEPAYDLLVQEPVRGLEQALWIGNFERELRWEEFLERVRSTLPEEAVLTGATPNPAKKVKKIAISTGSGNEFIPIVGNLPVDAYLTGEVKYHSLWEAEEMGLNVVTVGHNYSELFFSEMMITLLQDRVQGVEIIAQ
ncbi:MAG: Nif3-like dinuclear metal center hexameric protein [bacterium]|jgi:dinuclear metal center YbgI/SA1388 family protein